MYNVSQLKDKSTPLLAFREKRSHIINVRIGFDKCVMRCLQISGYNAIIKRVIMNSELTKTLKSIVSKKVVPKQLNLHSSFVDWHWFRHVEVIE